MFQKTLKEFGASEDYIKVAHRSRFKDQLINLTPGLYAYLRWRDVILTLNGAIGSAIFQACLHSNKEDHQIICEAARRIRIRIRIRKVS